MLGCTCEPSIAAIDMKRVSQTDIAKKLGIHQSTVSCILNGYNIEKFDPETRRRVLDLAQRLGYRRSRQALLLRGERSRLIAVLDFGTASRVDHRRLHALCRAIWERGYQPLPMEANWFTYGADPVCELLLDQHVEGVVFSGFSDTFESQHMRRLKEAGIAIEIAMGVCPPGYGHCDVDREPAVAAMVRRLMEAGRRNPGLLLREATTLKNVDVRPDAQILAGFRRGVAEAGGDPDKAPVFTRPLQAEAERSLAAQGFDAMEVLMATDAPPDAVMCYNDQMAAGALAWCAQSGKHVPGDVAVVGFGDEDVSAFLSPTLTTFAIPVEAIAETVVDRLIQRVKAAPAQPMAVNPERTLLACEIVVRQSCGLSPHPT